MTLFPGYTSFVADDQTADDRVAGLTEHLVNRRSCCVTPEGKHFISSPAQLRAKEKTDMTFDVAAHFLKMSGMLLEEPPVPFMQQNS